jgi:hypothetical protein
MLWIGHRQGSLPTAGASGRPCSANPGVRPGALRILTGEWDHAKFLLSPIGFASVTNGCDLGRPPEFVISTETW